MNVLGMDTSGAMASVSVWDGGVRSLVCQSSGQHAAQLMPMVEQALLLAQVDKQAIEGIGVAIGPGSFTGIKIAVSTAKALCGAWGIPIAGVTTLEALCGPVMGDIICPMLDARAGQVYTAVYRRGACVLQPCALTIGQLCEHIRGLREHTVLVGDGAVAYREHMAQALGEQAVFAPSALHTVRADVVAQLAHARLHNGEKDDALQLSPLYVRVSQAQREYEARHE